MPSFPNKGCPRGYTPSGGFTSCSYTLMTNIGSFVFSGCRMKYCRKAIQIPECSSGYYGSNCWSCPGPIENPCNLHGNCDDSIRGSGRCTCEPLFSGTACEKCANDTMFGPECNQTCTCVHGSCDDGVHGNGTCKPNTCQDGFHGDNCDLTDKSCVGSPSPLRCHYQARCVNDGGQDVCKCNSGYEGSGLQCYEVNHCTKPNRGGCHKDAQCTKTGPGTNTCTCNKGFSGDGTVCIAINPCRDGSHPRCHSNAECKFIGPGQSTCQCKPGFTGNGANCAEINNCLVKNGGCSKKATCSRVGPGKQSCTCFHGYIGNGYSCLGSVAMVLKEDERFVAFFNFIEKAHMEYYLSMETMNLTIFAPSKEAIKSLSKNNSDYWTRSPDRLKYFLQNHMLNKTVFKKDFKNNSVLTAITGEKLSITVTDTVILNAHARLTSADFVGANGVIHIINTVLVPPRIQEIELPSLEEAFGNAPELSNFYNILKKAGILPVIENGDGCTIFAPVNDVFSENKTLTSKSIKYHTITKYIYPGHFYNGQEFPTLLDKLNYKVMLTKTASGEAQINGVLFYNTPIRSKFCVIYKLSSVLKVPSQRRCDKSRVTYGVTSCRLCLFSTNCPQGWTKVKTQGCRIFWVISGCQALCKKTIVTKKCCSGFWGQDCQACPGNVMDACSGNGKCLDGISGSGHCQCRSNFTGTACEKCLPDQYGRTCASKCVCVNGRCNDGPVGDGSCSCRHGWHSSSCDARADAKNCQPTVCGSNSTCRNISNSFQCDCDDGYTGNGTSCRAIHPCDTNNGGCHKYALCSPSLNYPALATCYCRKGYTGDGQFCAAIDLCQRDNGNCHQNATCASIGPGLRTCHCADGFHGDGLNCVPDDPCKLNNGGCSIRAMCRRTGPGQRKCQCNRNYYGDGLLCIGNSMELLKSDPELTEVNSLFKKYEIDKLLESGTKANILAPTNRAIADKLNKQRRKRRDVADSPTMEQYLRYHIIGCIRFGENTFKTERQFTSLLGAPIQMSLVTEGNNSRAIFKDVKGNVANVTKAVQSENGFVFKLDALLTPPREYLKTGDPKKSIIEVANEIGYTTSASLLKKAGLETIFSNEYGRPYLVFLTTNQGIDKLPLAFKERLLDPSNINELKNYIKYHVVQNAPENLTTDYFVRSGGGLQFKTMLGQSLYISCKGDKGDLKVNGISRIAKRDIRFKGGIAFVVDDVITPLGLGGKCEEILQKKTTGPCGNCLSADGCSHDTTLVGTVNHNCSYNNGLLGCQHICMKRAVLKQCCPNFYGSDCRACPGGIGMTCSRRGQCDDGLTGSGRCACKHGYSGTSCERCMNNATCTASIPCDENNGGCHAFAACSNSTGHVNCTCKRGYEGDGFYCQMIDPCNTNNGGCGVNSTCHFIGPGERRCQCKPGFTKTFSGCTAFMTSSPCAVNHGGCSDHAYCSDTNGTASCVCWDSYVGNGYTCHGNILQSLQNTPKTQAFYKALYHLRLFSQGQHLLSSLQVDAKRFTVLAPMNSAVRIQDFNLTVIKNHIISSRLQLSSISSQYLTVTSLLGTQIMIRKLTNNLFVINGVAHVLTEIKATNGLIYIIDQAVPIVGEIPQPPTTQPTSTKTPGTSSPTTPTTNQHSTGEKTTTTTKATTKQPKATTAALKESSTTLKVTTSFIRPTTLSTRKPPTLSTNSQLPSTSKPRLKTTISSKTKRPKTTKSTDTNKPGVLGRNRKDERVGGGVIAGVLITVLLVIIMIAGAIWFVRKRHMIPHRAFRYKKENDTVQYDSDVFQDQTPSLSYNNPMYDVSEPGPDAIQLHSNLSAPFKEHTDFSNPIYELEDIQGGGESTDQGPQVKILFNEDEKPGEELC